MGYTATEARRGLRSAEGDIDRAIEFIIEVRIYRFDQYLELLFLRIVEFKMSTVVKKKCERKKNEYSVATDTHKMVKSKLKEVIVNRMNS